MTWSLKNSAAVTALAMLCVSCSGATRSQIPRPSEDEMEFLVGQPMPSRFSKLDWRAGEPPQSNLVIYAVVPPRYEQSRLEALAKAVGISGPIVPMPDDLTIAPGYWIKEPNPTNSFLWTSVYFSKSTGLIGHGSWDSGHRWDLKNRRPFASGVPDRDEAFRRVIALLPALGVTTNDLELRANGTIRWQSTTDGTTYTDRTDKQRKRYIRQRTITLFQRVPNGGITHSIGNGGCLEAGFVSEGKLTSVEMLFRQMKEVGQAKPLTKKEVIKALEKGRGWTLRQFLPPNLTVTNCALVYPQGNSDLKQAYVWPFYGVTGFSIQKGQTNAVNIYVPLSW